MYIQNETVSFWILGQKAYDTTTLCICTLCTFFSFVRKISSNIWLRDWYINLRLFCLWFAKCIKYSQTDHAHKKIRPQDIFLIGKLILIRGVPYSTWFILFESFIYLSLWSRFDQNKGKLFQASILLTFILLAKGRWI